MAEKEINEALFTLRREVEQLEDSHPELKDKFIAQYEAKFGEKPPKMEVE